MDIEKERIATEQFINSELKGTESYGIPIYKKILAATFFIIFQLIIIMLASSLIFKSDTFDMLLSYLMLPVGFCGIYGFSDFIVETMLYTFILLYIIGYLITVYFMYKFFYKV